MSRCNDRKSRLIHDKKTQQKSSYIIIDIGAFCIIYHNNITKTTTSLRQEARQ